jgi:hypothetical protein
MMMGKLKRDIRILLIWLKQEEHKNNQDSFCVCVRERERDYQENTSFN